MGTLIVAIFLTKKGTLAVATFLTRKRDKNTCSGGISYNETCIRTLVAAVFLAKNKLTPIL